MFASRSDGTMPQTTCPTREPSRIDGTTRIIRGLSWLILVFVMS